MGNPEVRFIDEIIDRMGMKGVIGFTYHPDAEKVVFRTGGKHFSIWGYATDRAPLRFDHPLAGMETRAVRGLLALPGGMLGRSLDTIRSLIPLGGQRYSWPSMNLEDCVHPEGFAVMISPGELGTPQNIAEIQLILEAVLGLNGRWVGIGYY